MVTRLLLILTMAGVVVIGTAGCSSAPHPGAHAPTSTPILHPSLTPSVPRAPRVGDVAPDFALYTLDGTRIIHLSDFRSKAVLLFFWATTCSSCVKELPILQRFSAQQQAVGKQMVVLGVDLDKVSDFVKVAILQQRLGLTYLILVDDHFQARSNYQITDVPLAYFLDRQHVIHSIVPGLLDDTLLHKEASNVER
jgi:peroxiredoxin